MRVLRLVLPKNLAEYSKVHDSTEFVDQLVGNFLHIVKLNLCVESTLTFRKF